MNKLRLRYRKVDRAKYISHLDLMSTMRRALLRAGIALKYSEGFNPHPFMSVALPLSVGLQSECELMDIGVLEDVSLAELIGSVSECLPEGLDVLEVYIPGRKFNDIQWLQISGELRYDNEAEPDIIDRLKERFNQESIVIQKKTKRGVSEINIAPYVRDVEIGCFEAVKFNAKISVKDPTLNPGNIMDALSGEYQILAPDFASFTRLELFDSNMNVFR